MNLSNQKLMFVKLVPKLGSVKGKNTKQNNRNKNINQLTIMPGTMTRSLFATFTLSMYNTSLFYPPVPSTKKMHKHRFCHLHIDHNAPCLYPPPPPPPVKNDKIK